LPWSRERQVGQLLIEARRLRDEGEDKKAMLKVQRALALHPQSVEAIALREELTKRSVKYPSRSMLDEIAADMARRVREGEIGEAAGGGGGSMEDGDGAVVTEVPVGP